MINSIHPVLTRDLSYSQNPLNISSFDGVSHDFSQKRLFPGSPRSDIVRRQQRETENNMDQAFSSSSMLSLEPIKPQNFFINIPYTAFKLFWYFNCYDSRWQF